MKWWSGVILTTPSIIYEQEKVELYTAKTTVAGDMIDKKLFSKEFLKYNNKISQDLFDAGHTINDWYSKDKKLAKDYFSKAIKLATEFDQMTELGNSFGISGNITFAKQILNKAKPLAKTFDQKWTLVNKYAQAGLYDIAKKIGAEAINMLEKTSEKKEYTKELDSVTSIF